MLHFLAILGVNFGCSDRHGDLFVPIWQLWLGP